MNRESILFKKFNSEILDNVRRKHVLEDIETARKEQKSDIFHAISSLGHSPQHQDNMQKNLPS